jgi:GxxExxY protein
MHDPITSEIIAAAYKVHNKLGFGFLEKVYENAMFIELLKQKLPVIRQAPLHVIYEQEIVGEFQVDLWVDNQIIVGIKSVRQRFFGQDLRGRRGGFREICEV